MSRIFSSIFTFLRKNVPQSRLTMSHFYFSNYFRLPRINSHIQDSHTLSALTEMWLFGYGKDFRKIDWIFFSTLTFTHPLRKKLRMRWFFDVSKVKEASFFKSDLTDPLSDFLCASFWKYQFKPFQLSFFSGFLYQDLFWVRWFYSLSERMRLNRKKRCFCTLTTFFI